MKEQLKVGSCLYQASRIRDPIVRKQAIANIKRLGRENNVPTDLSGMFTWVQSVEGHTYWSKLSEKYKEVGSDPTLWADEPIDDEWPNAYWIKNPWIGNRGSEFVKLINKIVTGDWYGTTEYYKIENGKMARCQGNEPEDELPIVYRMESSYRVTGCTSSG